MGKFKEMTIEVDTIETDMELVLFNIKNAQVRNSNSFMNKLAATLAIGALVFFTAQVLVTCSHTYSNVYAVVSK